MRAIGNNLIVNETKIGVSETKGGLFLAEKQREDVRYAEGTVLFVGDSVKSINKKDVIYFDKNNSHPIEIKKEIYLVVNLAHVVVVL
jgi:co-chaperonin GroES (HSP10)